MRAQLLLCFLLLIHSINGIKVLLLDDFNSIDPGQEITSHLSQFTYMTLSEFNGATATPTIDYLKVNDH